MTKKSSSVPATLVLTVAAMFAAGCGSGRRVCVDSVGRTIPDQECVNSDRGIRTSVYAYPHWIYRSGGGGFWGGVRSGSFGSSGVRSSPGGTSLGGGTTTRGGFGSSSSGAHSMGS